MSETSGSPPVTAGRRAGRGWRPIGAVIALMLVATVVVLVLSTRAGDPDAIWRAVKLALDQGRIADAAKQLGLLTKARAPLPRDWMLRGLVALAEKRTDDAVAAFRRVPETDGLAPQAWLLIGQAELRRNRAKDAESALLKALELDPALVQAHRELIFIYGMQLRRDDLKQQFNALSRLTDLTYQNVFHWCLLRNCLWEPGEVAEALSTFLEADPDDRQSRLALADNYRRLGLFEEADQVLDVLPEDDAKALAERVMLAMDRHQEDRAEELLAQGPLDDPDLARIRGRIALARRNGPEAVRFFRIAYENEPTDHDTLFGLIGAYELIGDVATASALRREAKKLETLNSLIQRAATPRASGDVNLVKELGAACADFGLIPEARAWYKIAIARDPLDAASQQALFRLNDEAPSRPTPAEQPSSPTVPHNP